MAKVTNIFDGGTNATDITVANSGGASGNAFNAVAGPTGFIRQYSSTFAKQGTLSYKCGTGATAGIVQCQWGTALGTITTTLYGRMYMYFTAFPPASLRVFEADNGASLAGALVVSVTTGFLRVKKADATDAIGSVAIATNQWIRVEWKFTAGATATLEANLYNTADSLTADDTITVANVSGQTQFTLYSFGISASQANITAFYFDALECNDTGYPGPYIPPETTLPRTYQAIRRASVI